jgi:hypothetical protein
LATLKPPLSSSFIFSFLQILGKSWVGDASGSL